MRAAADLDAVQRAVRPTTLPPTALCLPQYPPPSGNSTQSSSPLVPLATTPAGLAGYCDATRQWPDSISGISKPKAVFAYETCKSASRL